MTSKKCPSCSHDIPEHAPAGICPKCLLQAGIGNGSAAATVAPQGTYLVPAADSLIGKFPNLEIEYLIGQGGMGAVYKARQTNLDRVVALKILSPQLGDDPTFAERFTREARTLAKLSHPNIVTVFDFGVADSMHYLVMEFIDGVNLRDTILATEYDPAEALAVIGQVCDALQYAHDAGVVHRDIKPENILVDKNGGVKIADFGLAKLLSPTPEEFTLTGTRQVLGTLKYMAPEQIEKPEQVDHRADLYSLGVVFYELLTGELPIGRFAVPSAKAEINRRLDDVVLKTLEKEPNERYQQASEIKTAVAAASIAHATPQPIENAIPVTSNAATTTPNSYAVPFTTDDILGGMCKGFGIAKLVQPNNLQVEIEVVDCFGAAKFSQKTVEIPIDQLSSVKFRSGFFKDKITIQASSFAAFRDVPSAKQGLLNIYTKKSDAPAAEQLTIDVHNRLPTSAVPYGQAAPTAPVKQSWNAENDEDVQSAAKSIRVPMFGLLFVGVMYMLTAIFGSFYVGPFDGFAYRVGGGRWVTAGNPNELPNFVNEWLKIGGPQFSDTFIALSWIGAPLMFATAYLLWRRKNHGLAFAFLLLCCLPLHPLTVLSFIFAVWGLIVICSPAGREVFSARHKVGRTHVLALSVLLAISILALPFVGWLYFFAAQNMKHTQNARNAVSVQAEASSEVERVDVVAGPNTVQPIAPIEKETIKKPEIPGYNNPSRTGMDDSAPEPLVLTPAWFDIGLLFLIVAFFSVAFLTVIGLILYFVLRKPKPT